MSRPSKKRNLPSPSSLSQPPSITFINNPLVNPSEEGIPFLLLDELPPKKRVRNLNLPLCPPVNCLQDLINVGKGEICYRNINNMMLWKIAPYLIELNSMIGMEGLKTTVFFQIIYYLQNMHIRPPPVITPNFDNHPEIPSKHNANSEYLHTILMGAPGSGKTTVAKIVAKIYQNMGILKRNGPFKIAYRDDFVGKYLGSTAIKTRELLESCIGGVLFIDEIYSITSGKDGRDSFGKEALDTLTAFLSEHKSDFCCIAAGYEKDINESFFASNQGLARRFPWRHKIEEYSSAELVKIFNKMCTEISWTMSVKDDVMEKVIKDNVRLFKFAGGDIEVFLSKAKMLHAKRVFGHDISEHFILTEEDITAAIKYTLENNKEDVSDKIPWGMYI